MSSIAAWPRPMRTISGYLFAAAKAGNIAANIFSMKTRAALARVEGCR